MPARASSPKIFGQKLAEFTVYLRKLYTSFIDLPLPGGMIRTK